MKKKTKGWSEVRRQKQAANIRKTRPWKHSTGPKTEAGKAVSSRNAYKHGLRSETVRELKRVLSLHKAHLRAVQQSAAARFQDWMEEKREDSSDH